LSQSSPQELQQKNQALTESLDQQTATSEILRVIASSPTDVQPVFDAIASSAAHLCRTYDVFIRRLDEDGLRLVAHHGPIAASPLVPVGRGLVSGRAVLDRQTVHVVDVQSAAAELPEAATLGQEFGHRTNLGVPLLREGVPLGVIVLRRAESKPFTDQEIALLQTFADQAVIAIENVRLFKELEARNRDLTVALDQQTATAEILRVISQSPTDVQPVFDAIASSAVRLCESTYGVVHRFDGTNIELPIAMCNVTDEQMALYRRIFPLAASMDTSLGESALTRRTVQVEDTQAEHRYTADTEAVRVARDVFGYRTVLMVPMVQRDQTLGIIAIWRREQRPFSAKQIALVETFADQAVIAIENVRLFTELQEKNRALTEALDQQTATSEILRVISSSPTDIQPVFDTIVESAMRLCEAVQSNVQLFDGELMHWCAQKGISPAAMEPMRRIYPMRPDQSQTASRAVLRRSVVHLPDVLDDPEYRRELALKGGWRSVLSVPMMREGHPIGAITVARLKPGAFSETQMALLQTFADQAVIAIENVRLFKELEARTHDLTRSVGELQALGEIGQAISSTLDLQTVLSTIVARATQLSGTDAGVIYEYDELREVFVPRATEHVEAEIVEAMLATPVRRGEGATGRLAEVQEPIQVPDILAAPAESRVRGALVHAGYRALLAVPLVREGHLLGGLTVIRKTTGAFAPEAVELLQTFATQSSLAIQNAHLFLEIDDKSRQLELASQHKSEFLANMSHELRTPLNAIIGFSEVLTDRMFGELNEKQEEYLKDIYASGTHLLSLINDILDLSKIEAGRMELELTDFDLPTALDNALMLVRERAQRRSLTLHKDVDAGVGQIQGDERKIRQVVLNLLSNAIKFTPEGGRIELAAVPKDGLVEVSVIDTGIGIAAEDHEKVFEEFRQVGAADKKAEGTGLGLTLCRKFIELHGGRIWVQSQVGVGSTFTFRIPIRGGSNPNPAKSQADPPCPGEPVAAQGV
jgi:signal transduction histidine kinase/putative methionine-R-sulfoxide reductase with GAF domain